MVSKHKHINVVDNHKNVVVDHRNVVVHHKNVVVHHKNVVVDHNNVDNPLSCAKCNKSFKSKWSMDRHIKSCLTKIKSNVCEYCNKCLSDRCSKYRHHKICKVRIEKESTALVHVVPTSGMPPSTVNNTIQNLNGDNIQNQTNNTNNTVINLVVYNSDPRESIQFNHNHIDPEKLKRCFVPGDRVQPERLQNIVREWTQQLLLNDENKCVKKTNIRSSHSKVHIGNNNWESRLDKDIYPNLMNNIANDFSEFFNDNYRRTVYKALDKFIDYMASDGYCSNDSDKVIENSYKTLVRELKLRMFDMTKNESAPVPAPQTVH
jgi:hypothetical protein